MTTAQTNTSAPSVGLWRWIAAVLALTQLAAPLIANALAGNFLKSGATNQALITPAGYAFSLWGFSVWLLVAAQDWLWVSVAVFAVMV
ncbi:MAG: hypothetical protein ACXWD5_17340, partial [Mycobacterium sp.]